MVSLSFDIVVPYMTNIHGYGSKPGIFNWTTLTKLNDPKTWTNIRNVIISHLPSKVISLLHIVPPPSPPPHSHKEPTLINVPFGFKVQQSIVSTTQNSESLELQLASNYNLIKILASIFQTVYGAFELYAARGNQLDKYGYAAYAFTVVPYTMMSVVNLVAALFQPQYPSKFVVTYGGISTERTIQ